MSAITAVPRNTAWLLVGRVVAQGLAVVMIVVLAARIGVVGLGQYAVVSAVVLLANVGTTFGTDMVLIREIAGHGRLERWMAALVVQLALSALAIAVIWVVAPFIPGQSHDVVVAMRILALTLVPSAFFNVCTAVLRGVAMMGAYAVVGVAAAGIQLVAVAVFVRPGASVVTTAVVLVGAQTVLAVAVWTAAARRIGALRHASRPVPADVGDMARASMSVGALGLLGVLYQRLGAIAVSVVVGPVATGWFAGASRIVEASKTAHLALFSAVYPAMAEAHGDRGGEQAPAPPRRDLDWSWRLCIAMGGAVTAGLLLLGPFLIDWLYGPSFGPSKSGLAILALTVIPSTVATYTSLALLASHREGETLRVLGISLVVLVMLLAVLVPSVGWLGACWAVLAADTTQAALMLVTRGRTAPRRAVTTAHAEGFA